MFNWSLCLVADGTGVILVTAYDLHMLIY